MIQYPNSLVKGQTIGVSAMSSGVDSELHHILRKAAHQFEQRGYSVELGDTAWSNEKLTSASPEIRVLEFMEMMNDEEVGAIIPPWGGEFLSETLPLLEFERLQPKWIVGYSDTSTLLLPITLLTGIATVHATNFVDLRSDEWDPVTAKFMDVLAAEKGDAITQYSSEMHQTEWQHFAPPEPYVFKLDAPTEWKTLGEQPVQIEGRILSGCIDTIRHLIGTPFGDIQHFREKYIPNEKIIWVLENCEMDAADFYRSLLQFHYAGWFENTSGIVFGRTAAGDAEEDFTYIEALERISKIANVPVVYDADIGHVPPQMTFVNGAFAELDVADGKAVLITKLI